MVDVTSQFGGFITELGAAQLTLAEAQGKPWRLTHMLIGDGKGSDPVPDPKQKALLNQVYRAPLNQLYVSPSDANVLVAELVIPADVGGWWIREVALEDENGHFSAVANCPPSYKPLLVQNTGRNQVVRMHIITSSTQNIQLKLDPSVVLASRAYVDGLIASHISAGDPHPQYQLRGAINQLSTNQQLTAAHEGLVLLSAADGNRTFTLPAANAALRVREYVLRRTDATVNSVIITASGTDKIMLDSTVNSVGQSTTELLFAGDYLRLRAATDGVWWCVGQAQIPGSLASGLSTYTAAGNYTYTVPAVLRSGRLWPTVKVIGAGGGAGRNSQGGGGGGGGGEGLRRVNLTGVVAVAITVGAGGAGASSGTGSASGYDGGSSSFGNLLSSTGGGGGANWRGGNGGTSYGADFSTSLGPGESAARTDSISTSTYRGGSGGGPGAITNGSGVLSSPGISATAPGGGGGGGNENASGGNGAAGAVIIKW